MYDKTHVTRAFNEIQRIEKLTTVDMAKRLTTSRPSFIKLLNGESYPSLELLVKFIDAFPKMNLEWMFSGEGEPYVTDNEALAQKNQKIDELLSLSKDKTTLIKLLQDTITAYKDHMEILKKKSTR